MATVPMLTLVRFLAQRPSVVINVKAQSVRVQNLKEEEFHELMDHLIKLSRGNPTRQTVVFKHGRVTATFRFGEKRKFDQFRNVLHKFAIDKKK